ncbi:MAG: PaaI family thioesterase [Ahrensia sp.]|nr:PaaI family thioesterase [Ahrensia sp.]
MSIAELRTFIAKEFPQSVDDFPDLEVTRVDAGRVDLRMRALTRHLRPGGTVSGPTLFGLVDLAGYFCVLTHIGPEALSVTTNLNINFMRKADPGLLDVEARILKLGKRLMVFDASVTQSDADNIIAHATGTYAIPPRKQEG